MSNYGLIHNLNFQLILFLEKLDLQWLLTYLAAFLEVLILIIKFIYYNLNNFSKLFVFCKAILNIKIL